MPDGSVYDSKELLALLRDGASPFAWDGTCSSARSRRTLLQGLHIKQSNGQDIMARLARNDVNMPEFDGFPIEWQASEAQFEAAVYELLRPEAEILASRLLYHRFPAQHPGTKLETPQDLAGRRLFLFETAEGENNVWWDLSSEQKAHLLTQAAHIRASLFTFTPPSDFTSTWLRERLFEQKPELFPIPVAPIHEFCLALFTSKIEATIKNIGDMIGWEDDNETVGSVAFAAKLLALEHGDFGIHNMSITMNRTKPRITSLYDWETGCIVPAILSDPLMAVDVDLISDENAALLFSRVADDASEEAKAEYMACAKQYFKVLFEEAPDYEHVIQMGKDLRHIWFALRDWRGEDPEGYLRALGAWAEDRLKELAVE
ncbi:hypothetical protein B0H63DRAFT_514128 [Podospora didyma]|uniref:Aminoglycoside phosphotransferase domain-containing protein n=1 Tax=Podospora didyma TaxID=330526 RepID=A0AAE0K590_9PEZI|nr:hypothetical protein B0H63DRAFT_514128 [Podospora didyma]